MITIVAATNRPGSNTHRMAHHYQGLLAAKGLKADILSLAELPRDFIFSDLYGARSEAFAPIEQRMAQSEGYVFVVPEYNGSYPGVLKAFIDSMNPQKTFWGKYAALIGVSTGRFGNLRGLEHLAGVLSYIRMELSPFRAHVMFFQEKMNGAGEVVHEPTRQELAGHVESFLALRARHEAVRTQA